MYKKHIIFPRFLIFLIIFLTVTFSLYSEKRTVRIGLFPAPPLVFKNDEGKADGFFIDLVEYFAIELDWNIEYIEKGWSDLLVALKEGEIDLLPAIAFTEERTEIYDYTAQPVFIDSGVLFRNHDFTINTVYDLQGKRISAARDSIFTKGFIDYIASFNIECEIILTDNNEEVMQAIDNGDVHAGVCIYSLGNELSRGLNAEITPITFMPLGLSFAVQKEQNKDILSGINSLMTLMQDDPDSIYSQAFNKWILPQKEVNIPSYIWVGIAFLMAVGLAMVLWNVTLNRQVGIKTKELRRNGSLLQQSQKIGHIGSFEMDLFTNSVIWSEQLYELFGYKKNNKPIDYEKVLALIHPDDRERAMKVSGEAAKHGKSYELEHRVIHPDGKILNLLIKADVIRNKKNEMIKIVGIVQDITERKKAEKALQESEERLELAINAANLGMWDWNIKTGKTIYSEHWTKMLGYELDELEPVYSTWETLIHPDDKDRVLKAIDQHIKDSNFKYDIEIRMKTKSGSWKWINTRGRVVTRDEEKNPLRMVGTHIDISNSKDIEQLLRHSEKMEAIANLAGGIAHDFNNVLTGIFGYAELCLHTVPNNSKISFNIKQILKAGVRAKRMVNQMLLFSSQNDELKTAIFLRPIIKEAIQLLRGSLPSSIKIKSKLAKDTKPVLIDPTKIHELIINLCTNASHAMKDSGILEINYSEKHLKSELKGQIGIINPGFYSVITVKDNGCGINKETLSHIFEPFFTTKPTGRGTGMGLAVVFGIVQNSEGNIIVESKPDAGTKFEIYLPETNEVTVEEDTDESMVIQGGTESILLVDDEEILKDVIKDLLSSLGYKVTAFMNGINALDAFRKAPESFDIVITDQTMPDINGLELSKELLHIRQSIPIILYTGYSKLVDEDKALKSGIKGFLNKPISRNDLAYKIRYILDV